VGPFSGSDDSLGSEEKLGKKIQNRKGSGGEGGEGVAPSTKKQGRGGVSNKGKGSGGEG
jgi:hypothetical protein